MTYQSVNPYDGSVLKTFETATDVELEVSLVKATTCFELWRLTTYEQRRAVAEKAADMMS